MTADDTQIAPQIGTVPQEQRNYSTALRIQELRVIRGSKTNIILQPGNSLQNDLEATPTTAWISVGLESIDDIIKDFKQTFSDTK
ncbi:hypothetical protein BDZ45DRAFT_743206 [Acephala macrosclerotiorum]|nr:hypothetical protein BDZ45DRAFT_743206 [Acephala macrosclerotiorum]